MLLNVEKYADLMVNYSANVKKGDKVLIWGKSDSIPLIREIFRLVVQKDAHPYVKIDFPDQDYLMLKNQSKEALAYVDPFMDFAVKTIDVAIILRDPANTREMASIEGEKVSIWSESRNTMYAIFFERAAKGEIRWIFGPYPSVGMSQEANMSVDEMSDLIMKTCFLDKEDPAAEWLKLKEEQQKYVDYLNKVKYIRIVSRNTDLTMKVEGRIWQNCAGNLNLPDGEVFTGPVEDSANGYITFSYPGVADGKEIQGIRLVFKDGVLVEATADIGENTLLEKLKIPGARQIGEVAIGTNWEHQKFVKQILFDEKMGGTVHVAIGGGYPETGSKAMSSLHWDFLCDMHEEGQIYADGKLIYEKGKFTI